MGPLDRIEKRLQAAGMTCKRIVIAGGTYGDGTDDDHTQRAPAILASIDAETMRNPYQTTRIIEEAHKIGKQYRKTLAYTYSKSAWFNYHFTFAAVDDMKRLDAAQAEANIFLEAYWKHQHDHRNGDKIDQDETPAAIEAGKKALAQYRAAREEARTA